MDPYEVWPMSMLNSPCFKCEICCYRIALLPSSVSISSRFDSLERMMDEKMKNLFDVAHRLITQSNDTTVSKHSLALEKLAV